VVNIHNYYFPSEIVANGLTFGSYLEHIRDLMKRSGLGDRPIWITETGFVSKPTETRKELIIAFTSHQALTRHQNQRTR
jgi:hypothetical protein